MRGERKGIQHGWSGEVMCVYIPHEDPSICADILSDQLVVSQLESTARILTTALQRHEVMVKGSIDPDNPFVVWAAAEWDHFMWLSFLGIALVDEHQRRFRWVPPAAFEIITAASIGHLMSGASSYMPSVWPGSGESPDIFDYNQTLLREQYLKGGEDGDIPTWTNSVPPRWLIPEGAATVLEVYLPPTPLWEA